MIRFLVAWATNLSSEFKAIRTAEHQTGYVGFENDFAKVLCGVLTREISEIDR